MTQSFHQNIPGSEVTIAMPAVDWNNAWDYNALASISDGLFIMGYGYHWSGSSNSGPNSPLTGPGYTITWTVIDYLNKPIDKKLLNEIILNLENDLKEIIRTNESLYKSLNEHKKSIEKGNILSLITEYPKLLQRPIIAKQIDNKIIKSLICRPPELLESFIK